MSHIFPCLMDLPTFGTHKSTSGSHHDGICSCRLVKKGKSNQNSLLWIWWGSSVGEASSPAKTRAVFFLDGKYSSHLFVPAQESLVPSIRPSSQNKVFSLSQRCGDTHLTSQSTVVHISNALLPASVIPCSKCWWKRACSGLLYHTPLSVPPLDA